MQQFNYDPSQPQPPDNSNPLLQPITITLVRAQWRNIFQLLQQGPWAAVNDILLVIDRHLAEAEAPPMPRMPPPPPGMPMHAPPPAMAPPPPPMS